MQGSDMTVAAVIVAAGRGTRAGGDVAKQWQILQGLPVIIHSVMAFKGHPKISKIVLVLNRDDLAKTSILTGVTIVTGGSDRAASVKNGLVATDGAKHVLIHDVARPLVTAQTISNVIDALGTAAGAAPALAVTDALWVGENDKVIGTQDRTGLFRAQTPQGFERDTIVAAHAAHPGGAADDVEVARAFGVDVTIVPGDEDNLKITHPQDFARAEQIIRVRRGY